MILMGLQPTRVQIEDGTPSKSVWAVCVHVVPRAGGGPGHTLCRQHPVATFPSSLSSPFPIPPNTFESIHRTRVMSDRAANVREKFPPFRILVIGRANAGKTTLLQRVCKTTESPIVRDRRGRMVTGDCYVVNGPFHADRSLQINADVTGTVGVGICTSSHALFLTTSYSVASMTSSMKFHSKATIVLSSTIHAVLRPVVMMNFKRFNRSLNNVRRTRLWHGAYMLYGSSLRSTIVWCLSQCCSQ